MSRDAPRIILHNDVTGPLATRLQQAMPTAEFAECNDYDDLPALLTRFKPEAVYSVRFSGTDAFPREALLGADGPDWIAVGGSGCDHLGQWDTERTTVTNSAGVAAAMMAEFIFGTVLYFTLDIPGLNADKAAHHWPLRKMIPLEGKTMLIVGLGHTGQAVAASAKAFGMTVIGTRARPAPMDNVDEVHAAADLPDLWPRADVIAVCVPLLRATRNLIDARAFAAMKPSAILVDVSRGGVINSDALINALRGGSIAAAALDVFETEPLPPESPFWELENAILSPHCSSVYEGWEAASFQLFLDNLARWQSGAELFNIVSPARGY